MQPRAVAARVLRRVAGNRESLSRAIAAELRQVAHDRQALFKELCFGVARWHVRLGAIRDRLLSRPLKTRDLDIACLLEIGLYQLIYMRLPTHASVDETVRAADALNKPWAKGVVNAVLRNFERERGQLLTTLDRQAEIRLSHPAWLLMRIRSAYPEHWEQICSAANEHPPMTLRVNSAVVSRKEYLLKLEAARLPARAHARVASACMLDHPVDVHRLPDFAAGAVSVQDAAAQLAAPLLRCENGMRVLDACTAPGGKAAHLLELSRGDIDLTLVEIDTDRARLMQSTLTRGGWRATCFVADAARPEDWWNGKPFDRILLDVPCSGTGVIRRHPDIKLLRQPGDIVSLRSRQIALLEALWPLLSDEGMLLYATCSILPEENEQVIDKFMAYNAAWLIESRATLPGDDDMDGFYFASLEKRLAN
ncbi:MAG: 16S rRNA (cytosine(967)-C(5))-methyltransferase RsmB [Gammaproteobacteria bacterium]|nr:16S rRNA (cytosine(967)-C(5))-methyltransferase RsmB [Gammaproteobacteria bacterium]